MVKALHHALCASQWAGESRFKPPGCASDCGDGSYFTPGGNCTRCACRACEHCQCIDMLGREMAPSVCSRENSLRKDLLLGHFPTAAECRHACNGLLLSGAAHEAADGGSRPWAEFGGTGIECSAWTFADGRCVGHVDLAVFTAGWQPQRVTHGLATCAATPARQPATPADSSVPTTDSVSPSSSARFVLLHTVGSFAYNPGVLARVARAHAQLAKTAHRYAIVQVSRAPPPSAPCRFYEPGYYDPQPNCSASRYAIGQEDARAHEALVGATHASVVHRVSEAVVQRTLGHLLLRKMGRIRWSDRRAPHWLSAGCDLPGIVWFAQMRSAGRLDPSLQHVWVVQHDVGWTGELPAILQRFDAGPDLLCDGLGRPPPDWPHAREHNHLPRDGVYGCLLPATRYSARLLDDQVDALRAGNVSYCEIRAASACAHASWPCKAAGLRGRGLLGPFSAYTSIDERALFAAASNRTGAAHGQGSRLPERCGKRADGAQVGRLYHRVYNVVGEKRRSRFADCPDVCYTDWPRPGRSPPPPPSSSGGAPPAVSTHRAHHGAASARHTSRQQGKPAKVLRAGARAI